MSGLYLRILFSFICLNSIDVTILDLKYWVLVDPCPDLLSLFFCHYSIFSCVPSKYHEKLKMKHRYLITKYIEIDGILQNIFMVIITTRAS